MELILTADRKRGHSEGRMNLKFVGFFGGCTSKTTVKFLLKNLLDYYFDSRTLAENTIYEYFEIAIKDLESRKSSTKQLNTLRENRKLFLEMIGMSEKEDKIVKYMNDYIAPHDKYCFRFKYDDYLVLADAMKIIFMYEKKSDSLVVKEYPLDFTDMFNAMMDTPHEYKCSFKTLKSLGKNGYIHHAERCYLVYPFLKFLNQKEDVEIGIWTNSKGGKSLLLDQSDRCMLLVTKMPNAEDFTFELEDLADAL